MIEILHRQPPMPSMAGHHLPPDLAQIPYHARYPLIPLHNQAPGPREEPPQTFGWGAVPKRMSQTGGSKPQTSNHRYSLPAVSDAAVVNSMLAPTYGGLYKANGHGNGTYQQTSRPCSPPPREGSPRLGSGRNGGPEAMGKGLLPESEQIALHLQIPSAINSSQGSLAEFAAQITCLFWFESSFTLHRVEGSSNTPAPMSPLIPEAKPTLGFQKWVTTILSTTQVSTNVVLLALMFIYRLKKLNPTVKGKPGSEYRLMTVALMLGNKFLDDNTYTNKTWAEVSGISVSEIHIMEVEFLSNMRYTLYASQEEWSAWHAQLGRFYDYFERALNTPKEPAIGTPTSMLVGSQTPYSSPPTSYVSSPARSIRPINGPTRPPQPMPTPSYHGPAVPPPLARLPDVDLRARGRKRSHDESFEESQAKRVSRNIGLTGPVDNAPPRLPIPNFSRTQQQASGLPPYSAQLPPPSNRAMSTVYNPQLPQRGDILRPPPNQLPSLGIKIPPMDFPQNRALSSMAASKSGSPVGMATTPTTDLLSPMNYNISRSSPYRPVRGVNTLLVPPPSASLSNPSQNVGTSDMHYQPLGKPSERRAGVVPYIAQAYPPQSWTHNPYQGR